MDNQLHTIPPMPSYKSKLDKTSQRCNSFSTYIFEPKDLVPFDLAWNWQKDWRQKLLTQNQAHQAVWILQHQKCYTLGRGANESNILFDIDRPPYSLHRIDRGGEVTHHLPGQLVVYPVIDLKNYKKDLDWYMRQLEQVIIGVLEDLGLSGNCQAGLTGVWIQGVKVGFIGIGCRRWITQHGFALNIDCHLSGFSKIVPCGLSNYPVGTLNSWLPGITIHDVQPLIRRNLCNRFNFSIKEK